MAPRNEERRGEILASTYRLLDEAPYDKVSLADIARGAGINKSLLQRYYPQKIDILKEMLTNLLDTTYGYFEEMPSGDADLFQTVSYFNMLFFAGVAKSFRLQQFLLATFASPELLDVWIDTICSWLRRYVSGKDFSMLDLRCALCFAMGGSMHLFQHQDELGIDYRFFCDKHIRTILEFLHYRREEIEAICRRTEEWIDEEKIRQYLAYCEERIGWAEF